MKKLILQPTMQASCGIVFLTVILVGHYIFNKGIRPNISCKIRNNHTNTRRYIIYVSSLKLSNSIIFLEFLKYLLTFRFFDAIILISILNKFLISHIYGSHFFINDYVYVLFLAL